MSSLRSELRVEDRPNVAQTEGGQGEQKCLKLKAPIPQSLNSSIPKFDGLVKSRKTPLSVIPAKAGIQFIQLVTKALDSGFHRSDDFLRDYQVFPL